MKFIKKYRKVITVSICVVILLVIFLSIKAILYPDNNRSIYGNRLAGIDKVPINENLKKDINTYLKDTSKVKTSSIDIRGKVINIIVDINKDVTVDSIEGILNEVLTKFTSEQKAFYDLQFFATQNEVSNNSLFPVIGYKNKNTETIVWN
jgi:hypothetical protein